MSDYSEKIARKSHEIYERLAPEYGYTTREDTREFDPESPNGKLMIAVYDEIIAMVREQYSGETLSNIVNQAKSNERQRCIEAVEPIIRLLEGFEIFICSKEKAHPDGQALYRECIEKLKAINEGLK